MLDYDRDALLEVDDINSLETLRFLISIKAPGLASPVFAIMFSLGFKEGKDLRNEGRVIVKLVDDNAHAIKLSWKSFIITLRPTLILIRMLKN